MRADNTDHLITAAKRRHEYTRAKTIRTLRELDQSGAPVTFETVAQHAAVSRSWLYTQPDIRDEIQRMRELGSRTPSTPMPSRQRTTESSLLRRLEIANNRNRQLTDENQRIRRQLEQTLGQLRAAGLPKTSEPNRKPHIAPSPFDNKPPR